MESLISISNLNKAYGRKHVLSGVNLSLNAGQIVGLVGSNGAGKTTCLQAVLGLTDYDGDISVLGYHPRKDRVKMLNEVAYIADVAILPKWLKVSQALSYMKDIHPNFDIDKAEAFLAKTNIVANDKVKALSKGMVAQLHLALILAIDAKVLILDEPTLGLDILTRRQFYTHLLEDFYTEDKCIVVTTHQIEEIEHILTDVAFIQHGKIVLAQSTDEIQKRFNLVTVSNEQVSQAEELNPLFKNSMMGLTTMLFDNQDKVALESLGKVSAPSLADINMQHILDAANQLSKELENVTSRQHYSILSGTFFVSAIILFTPFIVIGFIVQIYYFVTCFFDERRDQSVMFWRSLPVSDAMTITSKLITGAFIIPIIFFTSATLLMLILVILSLLVCMVLAVGFDISLWGLFGAADIVSGIGYIWLTLVPFALWLLPLYVWLMLASIYANKAPFLWAVLPVVGLVIIEGIMGHYLALPQTLFWDFLADYFTISSEKALWGPEMSRSSIVEVLLLQIDYRTVLLSTGLLGIIYWCRVKKAVF